MSVSIAHPDGRSLRFDAAPSVAFSPDIIVTEHAIDDGRSVADHIVEKGLPFTIRGVVSGTPLALPGITANPRRLQDAIDFLHECVGVRLVVVDSRLRPIPGCVITSFPYDLTVLHGITFEVGMKVVQVATSDTVRIPAERPAPRAQPDAPSDNDIGDQFVGPLPPEKEPDVADSWMLGIGQGLGLAD